MTNLLKSSCEGYLTMRTSASGPPPMQRRYCVLIGTEFYYYSVEEDAQHMLYLKGEVNVIGVQEWDGKGNVHIYYNGFLFATAQNKVFYAYADTPTEKEKWIRAIQTSVETTVPHLARSFSLNGMLGLMDQLSPASTRSTGSDAILELNSNSSNNGDIISNTPSINTTPAKHRCYNCDQMFTDITKELPLPLRSYYYAKAVCNNCYHIQQLINYMKNIVERLRAGIIIYPTPLNLSLPIELLMPKEYHEPHQTAASNIALQLFEEGSINAEELEQLLIADKRYLDNIIDQPEIPLDLEILALHRILKSRNFTIYQGIILLHKNINKDPLLYKPIIEKLLMLSYSNIQEIEFYCPQILHAYIRIPMFDFDKLFWLDEFILSICARSIHLALLLIWQLQGALEDALVLNISKDIEDKFPRILRLMILIETDIVGKDLYTLLLNKNNNKNSNIIGIKYPICTDEQVAYLETLMITQSYYRSIVSNPPKDKKHKNKSKNIKKNTNNLNNETNFQPISSFINGNDECKSSRINSNDLCHSNSQGNINKNSIHHNETAGKTHSVVTPISKTSNDKLLDNVEASENNIFHKTIETNVNGDIKSPPSHDNLNNIDNENDDDDDDDDTGEETEDGNEEGETQKHNVNVNLNVNDKKHKTLGDFIHPVPAVSPRRLISSNSSIGKQMNSNDILEKNKIENTSSYQSLKFSDFSKFQQHLLTPKNVTKTNSNSKETYDEKKDNHIIKNIDEMKDKQNENRSSYHKRILCSHDQNILANYFNDVCILVNQITDIAEKLRFIQPVSDRKKCLWSELENFYLPPLSYIPLVKATDPFERVIRLSPKEGTAFSTKARVPIMLIFEVIRGDTPIHPNSNSMEQHINDSNHISNTKSQSEISKKKTNESNATSHDDLILNNKVHHTLDTNIDLNKNGNNYKDYKNEKDISCFSFYSLNNSIKNENQIPSFSDDEIDSTDEDTILDNINDQDILDEVQEQLEFIILTIIDKENNSNTIHNTNHLNYNIQNDTEIASKRNPLQVSAIPLAPSPILLLNLSRETSLPATPIGSNIPLETPAGSSPDSNHNESNIDILHRKISRMSSKRILSSDHYLVKNNNNNNNNNFSTPHNLAESMPTGNSQPIVFLSEEAIEFEKVRKKDLEAAFGESWDSKKERIKKSSPYGDLPGWDIVSMIGKSNDDLRQEIFTLQLIQIFQNIFKENNIPIWLKVYRIISINSSCGLIETLTNAISLDGLKKRDGYVNLLTHFEKSYGNINTSTFQKAQLNFIQSMAGYSLICYFLQIKDRHNGNIMIDKEGHVIHIDYGFLLGIAPGGSFSIETAPFKLTSEMVETMGNVDSDGFKYYISLCTQGFLACQENADKICDLVEIMSQQSPYPCFMNKDINYIIHKLKSRFKLKSTKQECINYVLSLIRKSNSNYSTRQYDNFQRMSNGILP